MERTDTKTESLEQLIRDVLTAVPSERDQAIVSARLGLFDEKETLRSLAQRYQISLSRVREITANGLAYLHAAITRGADVPGLDRFEHHLAELLGAHGGVVRSRDLPVILGVGHRVGERARVTFLVSLCQAVVTLQEDDRTYASVGLARLFSPRQLKLLVLRTTAVVNDLGRPVGSSELARLMELPSASRADALAGCSKLLMRSGGTWGMAWWPATNPRNIPDKVDLVLRNHGTPMHVDEISAAIRRSRFRGKRLAAKSVSNAVLMDNRFVRIGRGIYALKEWGYSDGTVGDVIQDALREVGTSMKRADIVRHVLERRRVSAVTVETVLSADPRFRLVGESRYELRRASDSVASNEYGQPTGRRAYRAAVIGQAVRERRQALGLSQLEVARAARITQTHLSHIEQGRVLPAIGLLEKVAQALYTDLAVNLVPRPGRPTDLRPR